MDTRKFRLPAAALVLGASLGAWSAGGNAAPSPVAASAPAPVTAPAPVDTRAAGVAQFSYAPIVDKVAPAVVTIHAQQRTRVAQQYPFYNDPMFRQFFGDRLPQEQPRRREGALGSGVLVKADGFILTNYHVVDGADQINVELTDGRSFKAKVVGTDAPSDLAVLKIDGGDFPTLPLGNSDQVRVGDLVLAVGNPMGVGQTVTMGIVSAKGRATGLGDGSFEDFLQTDAPINQGNSGGALVNMSGELVGINSQILSPSGGNIGIGFAIPANMAQTVFESLVTDGRVHRGMLGVTVQSVTAEVASALDLDTARGALVAGVQAGSPAAKAGVEKGDVIAAVNGVTVIDSNAVRNMVARLKPGSKAELTIVRDGHKKTVTATLDELPSQTETE